MYYYITLCDFLNVEMVSHQRTFYVIVVTIFWARAPHRLAVEDARFRMKITPGVVLICSLACTKCVTERLWGGSGVILNHRFMRKSSSLANAPSMRSSVLLNSGDSFFVTSPSTPSDTWVMQFSCDLGTFESCTKLLSGCSSQFSLFRAANHLLLFLRVAIFHGKSNDQPSISDYFLLKENQFRFLNSVQQYNVGKQQYRAPTSVLQNHNNTCVFVLSFLLFIPFPAGKHNCLHAKSRYEIEKTTLYIITSK